MDFSALSEQCAPFVHKQTLHALVTVESGFNPYAIGVVRGHLQRQPRNKLEAIVTARELERLGYNYSVGLAQVNKHNFKKYGLTIESAFEPCESLRAGAQILLGCFQSAKGKFSTEQQALRGAFSCYYSGNFRTGFHPDFKGQPSYVDKVVANARPIIRASTGNTSVSLRPVVITNELTSSKVISGVIQPAPPIRGVTVSSVRAGLRHEQPSTTSSVVIDGTAD